MFDYRRVWVAVVRWTIKKSQRCAEGQVLWRNGSCHSLKDIRVTTIRKAGWLCLIHPFSLKKKKRLGFVLDSLVTCKVYDDQEIPYPRSIRHRHLRCFFFKLPQQLESLVDINVKVVDGTNQHQDMLYQIRLYYYNSGAPQLSNSGPPSPKL